MDKLDNNIDKLPVLTAPNLCPDLPAGVYLNLFETGS